MKINQILGFLLTLLSLNLSAQSSSQVSITIEGIQKKGTLMVGLYNQADDFTVVQKTFKNQSIDVTGKSINLSFSDLPHGEYALAIFQDMNSNGKLDKNIFGKPTEPYGFSNNIKPTFSAPTFKDCSFVLNGNKTVQIYLLQP